jgi:PTB domain (IRS-1 type)
LYFKIFRRYGVVDGRFCFEGGSACGKGEGLYIFITDVGEEITQTIKLAAQGQLALKKRPLVQKGASKSMLKNKTHFPFSCHYVHIPIQIYIVCNYFLVFMYFLVNYFFCVSYFITKT